MSKKIIFIFCVFVFMVHNISSSNTDDPWPSESSFAIIQTQASYYNALTENFLNNQNTQNQLPPIPEAESEDVEEVEIDDENNNNNIENNSDLDSDNELESDWEESFEDDLDEINMPQNMAMFLFMNSQEEQPDFFELGLDGDYQITPSISSDYTITANELYNTYVQTGDIYLSTQPLENQLRLLAIAIYWKVKEKDDRLTFIAKFINDLLGSFTSIEAMMLLQEHETLDFSISDNLFLPFILNVIDINIFKNETGKEYSQENILTKCVEHKNQPFADIIMALLSLKMCNLTCVNLLDKNLIGHTIFKANYKVFAYIQPFLNDENIIFTKKQINLAKKLYIGHNEKIGDLDNMLKILN